jgi:hypothetical protein
MSGIQGSEHCAGVLLMEQLTPSNPTPISWGGAGVRAQFPDPTHSYCESVGFPHLPYSIVGKVRQFKYKHRLPHLQKHLWLWGI